MNFQFWDLAAASAMFNNNNANTQTGSFPTNVSSYFRRPSRIVKPSSRNHSPRNTGRRRMTTTTHFPTRTRSVVDNQRSTPAHFFQYQQPSSRPISWHPNSMMEEATHLQLPAQSFYQSSMATPYTTTQVNGLVTPMSYPVVDEPQIYDLITPLEELSANDPGYSNGQNQGVDLSMTEYWLTQQQFKDAQNEYESIGGGMYTDMNSQAWYNNNQYQIHNIPTAPASPSYLPMPDFGGPLVMSEHVPEVEKEELVGMGLYDSPSDVHSSSLLLEGFSGQAKRKSLKLEDAFEPQPSSDEADDDAEEDTDADAEGEDDDEVLAKTADVGVGSANTSPEDLMIPLESYSYMMNNNDFTMDQWQHAHAQGQVQQQGYTGGTGGWI